MNWLLNNDERLRQQQLQERMQAFNKQFSNPPLTDSERYANSLKETDAYRRGFSNSAARSGLARPSQSELETMYPTPVNPIQAQIKAEYDRNPLGLPSTATPEWPPQPPSGLISSLSQEQPQWPVPVPDELIRTGGAGGGMRDSNIQDATGLTGGGALMTGGAGGGMRDSNIQDATGTTGGNAGANIAAKGFDWEGLAGGLGQLAKGMKGMGGKSGTPDMRVPNLSDDSASRMAAASQLWQAVMQKRKPRGLI